MCCGPSQMYLHHDLYRIPFIPPQAPPATFCERINYPAHNLELFQHKHHKLPPGV